MALQTCTEGDKERGLCWGASGQRRHPLCGGARVGLLGEESPRREGSRAGTGDQGAPCLQRRVAQTEGQAGQGEAGGALGAPHLPGTCSCGGPTGAGNTARSCPGPVGGFFLSAPHSPLLRGCPCMGPPLPATLGAQQGSLCPEDLRSPVLPLRSENRPLRELPAAVNCMQPEGCILNAFQEGT